MKETQYRRSITMMLSKEEVELLDNFLNDNEYISLPKYTKRLLFETFLPKTPKETPKTPENITL